MIQSYSKTIVLILFLLLLVTSKCFMGGSSDPSFNYSGADYSITWKNYIIDNNKMYSPKLNLYFSPSSSSDEQITYGILYKIYKGSNLITQIVHTSTNSDIEKLFGIPKSTTRYSASSSFDYKPNSSGSYKIEVWWFGNMKHVPAQGETYWSMDLDRVFEKVIVFDITPPTISISYKTVSGTTYTLGTWTNENVVMTYSASDADSRFLAFTKPTPWSLSTNSYSYTVDAGVSKVFESFTITAMDIVGNENTVNTGVIYIDKVPPSLTINITTNGEKYMGWVKNATVSLSCSDADSQINYNTLTLNGVAYTKPVEYKTTGTHFLLASVEDNAGNGKGYGYGNSASPSVKVDATPPVVQIESLAFKDPGANSNIQYVEFSYSSSDAHSDIYINEIWYTVNDPNGTYTPLVDTSNFSIAGLGRDVDNTIYLHVKATDNVGNSTTVSKSIVLPKLVVGKIEAKDLTITGVSDPVMNIPIYLGTLSLGNYRDIQIQRTFYVTNDKDEEVEITSSNFSTHFNEDERVQWTNLTSRFSIKEYLFNNNGTYYFTDGIYSSTGFGHKKIKYSFYSSPVNHSFIEYNSTMANSTLLPNNKGKIEWRLTASSIDKKTGESITSELILNSDCTIKKGSLESFIIPPTGFINISFRYIDYDMELATFELKEVIEVEVPQAIMSSGVSILSIPIAGGKALGKTSGCKGHTSGKDKGMRFFSDSEVDSDTGGWIPFSVPIVLDYNKYTCFFISGNEGYSPKTMEKNETGILRLKAESPDLGGYKLGISKTAKYNYYGITSQPFRLIDMQIEETNPLDGISFSWDMGDGKKFSGKSISHSYEQDIYRTGDTSKYDLTIILTKGNVDSITHIPVQIIDTRYGKMYGNEVWWGNHVLLSTVYVDKGQVLTIDPSGTDEKTEIWCYGDLNLNPMTGIQVMNTGKLVINNDDEENKVLFTEMTNTRQGFAPVDSRYFGWGTIFLNSGAEANISNTVFKFADRGITVSPGATLTLKNTNFIQNIIGLHIFGTSKATIDGCVFKKNEYYGIKEDQMKDNSSNLQFDDVTFSNSNASDNTVDYYDWDYGVLTDLEVKAKLGTQE